MTAARSSHGSPSLRAKRKRSSSYVENAAGSRFGRVATSFRQAIYSPNLGYTRTNLELGRAPLRVGRASEAVGTLQSALRGYSDGSNLYASRTELHEALADTRLPGSAAI